MFDAIQRSFIFPRHLRNGDAAARQPPRGAEQLWIDSPEGRVEGWLLPGDGVSRVRPGPAAIVAHGNAELIDDWPEVMAFYQRLGVSVLLAEYRGYGRSAGAPSEAAIAADMLRFRERLLERPEIDAARLIHHGRSIGGGAVCGLAAKFQPAALILQSTFTSMTALCGRFGVPGFLVSDRFDNLAVVSALTCPILMFHGRRDSIIPHEHAERLAAAATRARLVSYDCDHNDCPPDWAAFARTIASFLRDNGILP